jgi:RNA-directed DNA polymerase
LQLLHRHCHARKTVQDHRGRGTFAIRHGAEEPDDAKASRPVLNPSRGGDTPA